MNRQELISPISTPPKSLLRVTVDNNFKSDVILATATFKRQPQKLYPNWSKPINLSRELNGIRRTESGFIMMKAGIIRK